MLTPDRPMEANSLAATPAVRHPEDRDLDHLLIEAMPRIETCSMIPNSFFATSDW